MASKYGSRRKPASTGRFALAAFASFLVGGALVGYVVWYNLTPEEQPIAAAEVPPELPGATPIAGDPSPTPTTPASPSPSPIADAVAALEEGDTEGAAEAVRNVAEQQGGLDQRLAAAEQRLARLDLQAQAAAGNAARAEGLLIAFATRRAVERGAELGYLADQLRLRFSDQWPNAVNTIITFARNPIRYDNLTARLDGLGPQLVERDEGISWERMQREMSQLFVIRRESTPSSQPERRLDRARIALEQGRYQNAIDEIRGMPGAEQAESWIADAERFRDAMQALEVIETAAVLDQSGLRDGAGNVVRQPSPVDQTGDD
ncbi:hypothetical protein CD351_13115 [Erythrobacter sp. KY5]|uniref:hypothetical protein n=1 Tax=Erythrobacter sp. KY5 TaxID=2011159 RepID=UPI000DBF25CC|nr:hypothetical protein [Erythrobacter sp. KY5]AWW75370.1 hypothetical protein CD351_13115 [Erythrobacter sp. KY5]